MADKFEDLRNFVAVIDSGGINAAASSIGIAKSAVSRRLGELEQRLGTTLINRSNRRFEPTAVGRRYYEGARQILAALDTLDREASSSRASDPLRVTITAEVPLGPAVAAAVSTLPAADGVVASITDAQEGTVADLHVGTRGPRSTGLDRVASGSLGMAVVASRARLEAEGRPTSLGGLRAMVGIATASREADGWHFGKEGVHAPEIGITVPDDAAALSAALAGAGVARIPAILASSAIEEGRLEQVLASREPEPEPVGVWIPTDADGPVRQLADELAAALAAVLK